MELKKQRFNRWGKPILMSDQIADGENTDWDIISSILIDEKALQVRGNRLERIHTEIDENFPGLICSVHLNDGDSISVDYVRKPEKKEEKDVEKIISKWTRDFVISEMERTGKKWLNQ